jgi:type II pantothenate kinase
MCPTESAPEISAPSRPRLNSRPVDSTISHPGSVRINIEGAFIAEYEPNTPNVSPNRGGNHETKDIRLPNHTGVVSHIAVDVSDTGLLDVLHSQRLY